MNHQFKKVMMTMMHHRQMECQLSILLIMLEHRNPKAFKYYNLNKIIVAVANLLIQMIKLTKLSIFPKKPFKKVTNHMRSQLIKKTTSFKYSKYSNHLKIYSK